MATQGSLTVDISGLDQAFASVTQRVNQRINDMQKDFEAAGAAIGLSFSSAAQSAAQKAAGTMSQFSEAFQPASDSVAALIKNNAQLGQMLNDSARKMPDYSKASLAVPTQASILAMTGSAEADQVGMGGRQAALSKALSANDVSFANKQVELAKTYSTKGGDSSPAYQAELASLADAHAQMATQIQANYDAMTKSLGDWTNGATAAWGDYLDSAGNVAGKTKTMFATAFSDMDDAVYNFAMTGKFSFSDFAKSVIADMAKIAAKTATSSALSSLLGMAGSAVMSFFTGGSTPTVPGVTTTSVGGMSQTFNPQLDASLMGSHPGGAFAKGGAFTNSVATSPTVAPMALFGEAGPEAIMPLSRGPDGSLGVLASGAGQGTSSNQVVIQQTINVGDSQANATSGVKTQDLANAYAGAARQGAAEQIARDLQPGGRIWSAINGR